MKKLLKVINLPRTICNHILGKQHSPYHRICVGFLFMIVGVLVAKVGESVLVHTLCDLFGYGLHGIGLVPFVEHLEENT